MLIYQPIYKLENIKYDLAGLICSRLNFILDLIQSTYFNLWNAPCTKHEIDIPYVKRIATIGIFLIFNTNSFASKILTLLTKIEYTVHVPKSCSR